jgi:carbonic anhydrase
MLLANSGYAQALKGPNREDPLHAICRSSAAKQSPTSAISDYKRSPVRIIVNGHTIMVTYAAGNFIRVGDAQYQLKQFRFHRPSEAMVHGKSHDMELHRVHADEAGHLAVVAVLLVHGQESPLVCELWKAHHSALQRERDVVRAQTALSRSRPMR